jgi:hypothetical protein
MVWSNRDPGKWRGYGSKGDWVEVANMTENGETEESREMENVWKVLLVH